MKTTPKITTGLMRGLLILALSASALPFAAGALAQGGIATGIQVTFKLDPRLTRSLYMGDRWVSPQTFTQVQENGKPLIVGGRTYDVDARGESVITSSAWVAADSAMLTVMPGPGDDVNITVNQPGRSTLTVSSTGGSKTLGVSARYIAENTLMVDISQ